MLNVLGVQKGESEELGLVEVHHEQLICRGEVRLLARELTVEVAHVLPMFLEREKRFMRKQ